VAIAEGVDAVSGIAVRTDRTDLFGPVASKSTTWRRLDRLDDAHLPAAQRAKSRARPGELTGELATDATIAPSSKERAAAWKRMTSGTKSATPKSSAWGRHSVARDLGLRSPACRRRCGRVG
jgi:hypothetical protein